MGDERKSFCDLTVLFRFQAEQLLSQNVPGRLIAKSRSRTLIADCSTPTSPHVPPTTLFFCQLCRLFPPHIHTCCFFTPARIAEEAASDIPPSHQVTWSRDSAGEKQSRDDKSKNSFSPFLLFSFHHYNT